MKFTAQGKNLKERILKTHTYFLIIQNFSFPSFKSLQNIISARAKKKGLAVKPIIFCVFS